MNIYEYANYLTTLPVYSPEFLENYEWVSTSITGEYENKKVLYDKLEDSDKLANEDRLIQYLNKIDGKMVWGSLGDEINIPTVVELKRYMDIYRRTFDTFEPNTLDDLRFDFLRELSIDYIEAYESDNLNKLMKCGFFLKEYLETGLINGIFSPDELEDFVPVFDLMYDNYMGVLNSVPNFKWFKLQIKNNPDVKLKDLDIINDNVDYREHLPKELEDAGILPVNDVILKLCKLSYTSFEDYMALIENQLDISRKLFRNKAISAEKFDDYISMANMFREKYSDRLLRRYAPLLIIIKRHTLDYDKRMILAYSYHRLLRCYNFTGEYLKLFDQDALEQNLILSPLEKALELYTANRQLDCFDKNLDKIRRNFEMGLRIGIFTAKYVEEYWVEINQLVDDVKRGEV